MQASRGDAGIALAAPGSSYSVSPANSIVVVACLIQQRLPAVRPFTALRGVKVNGYRADEIFVRGINDP